MRFTLPVLMLAACALAGCTSTRVIENTRVPEIVVDEFGSIRFNGESLKLGQVASAVRGAGCRREQEINILIPERLDETLRKSLCAELVRGGYTRTIFIKNRKATARVTGK